MSMEFCKRIYIYILSMQTNSNAIFVLNIHYRLKFNIWHLVLNYVRTLSLYATYQ